MVEKNFKYTEVGLIPEDWEIVKLAEIGNFIKGKGISKSEASSGTIPAIRYGEIYTKHNNVIRQFHSNINEEVAKKSQELKKGDLLFAGSGETKEEIGKTVAFIDDKKAYAGGDIVILRPTRNTNSTLLGYLLNSKKIQNQKSANGQGDAVVHIYANNLKDISIPLLPLPEQQAIAEILTHTDEWIESLEKLIAKKRLIKQGAMQKLLTPKKNWKISRLEELTKIFTKQTGFDYSAYIKPALVQTKTDNDIPFIQNKDFCNKWINLNTDYYIPLNIAKDFPRILLDEKSLLVSISGAIGNVGVYENKELAFIGGAVAVLKFKNPEIIDWIMYYLKSDEGQSKLLANVKAGSHQNLILDDIRKIRIPIPSIAEQVHIAQILSDMNSEIEALEQKLAKARQIKQGMIQELLTGRIRLIETVKIEKTKASKDHNEHINDAVLIGAMAACFSSDQFPMTRFKYTKVSYLLKRYKEEQDTGYLKKAAGPYKPQTRYGGAEKIALQNKYVVSRQSTYKGTVYEGFVSGENVNKAIKYFKEWYGEEALQWINKFKFEKNDNLELWATVDMAIQDLKKEDKLVNVATVKQIIKENKEWKDKLKRPVFSDDNIHNTIIKMDTLFS